MDWVQPNLVSGFIVKWVFDSDKNDERDNDKASEANHDKDEDDSNDDIIATTTISTTSTTNIVKTNTYMSSTCFKNHMQS